MLSRAPYMLSRSSARTGGMALLCELSLLSLTAFVYDNMWQLFDVALMSLTPSPLLDISSLQLLVYWGIHMVSICACFDAGFDMGVTSQEDGPAGY